MKYAPGEVPCKTCGGWWPRDYLVDGVCAFCDGRIDLEDSPESLTLADAISRARQGREAAGR